MNNTIFNTNHKTILIMKKSLFFLPLIVLCGIFVSCDQDEELYDGWDDKEIYSLSATTRAANNESKPIEKMYILPGDEEETAVIVADMAEITFKIRWTGGFEHETINLTITPEIFTTHTWKNIELDIYHKFVNIEKVSFFYRGKFANQYGDTIHFIDEISKNVRTELRPLHL